MPQQQHGPHSSSRSKASRSSMSSKDILPSSYTSCSSSEGAVGAAGAQAGGRSSTAPNTQQDAADAAMYRDMREALAEFESQQRKLLSCKQASTPAWVDPAGPSCSSSSSRPARMPPRQTAFYAALRSVLQQVLAEATPAGRHTRLLAAHAWYVGHKPRPVPANPDLAAALAASLSINTPASPAAAGQSHARSNGSRAQSPTAATGEGYSDSGSSCSCSDDDASDNVESPSEHQQQDRNALNTAATGASTPALRAQRLEAAASSAYSNSWPKSSSNGNCGGSSGDVPGLIPVGCLPSSRFGALGPAAAAAAAGAGGGPQQGSAGCCRSPSPCHLQQQQQQQHSRSKAAWSAVVAQQAVIEAEVAGSVRGFAQQQARIEENISRRQELAAVMAATARSGGGVGSSGVRALQHVDSQHQPSQVAADLLLTAAGAAAAARSGGNAAGSGGGGSAGVQLVVPDRVKAARKQHLQEGVQECSLLQESLGLPDYVLARALLPPPDVPYMTAFAQLPTYHPAAKAAGKKMKGKKKEKKQKSGKGSSSKAGKAAKPGPVR